MKVSSLLHKAYPLFAFLLLLLLGSCAEEPKPIKVGFVGGLTGRVAGLGVTGRDAVLFAIEQRNQQGGIAGRPIELVVRDDKQDKETAKGMVGPVVKVMAMGMVRTTSRVLDRRTARNSTRI